MNPFKFLAKAIGDRRTLQAIDSRGTGGRGGWWCTVRESFTGAWQQNVTVNRDCVLAYWAVYACIKLISSDISKMRVKLVEEGDDGIWSEIKQGSPFLPVLRKPNRYQTRVQFWQYWIASKLIHGNTYVLKQRDARGIVVALYILDPCSVTVLVADDGSVWYQLRRDNLSGVADERLDITVPASEIIHDKMVCLHHPLVGVSPIFACGVAATQGLAIQNNSANFFTNGSMPGGIIKVPGALTPENAAKLKASWESGFTGDNSGKTAILADKMEYQPLTMTAVDAQLIEQLKWTAEVVCSTFGVPAYKIGAAPAPAYNNIAALDQQYYSQCLQSLIESAELCLDEGLGLVDVVGRPPYTLGTEFDLKALIRMDPQAQMQFVKEGIAASVFSPDEGRAEFDLGRVTGGASPMAQQQNYSLAALAKRDAQADPFGSAPAPAAPANTEPPTPTADQQLEFSVDFIKELALMFTPETEHGGP